MKKFIIILLTSLIFTQPSQAFALTSFFDTKESVKEERAVKKVLNSQVKYANNNNFEKFLATFSPDYKNADGFNLDTYSQLIKDIWETYDNVKYDITIKNISFDKDKAIAELAETSYAKTDVKNVYEGELKSYAETTYYLKKDSKGKWKVIYDEVINETTSMLYGDAKNLDIKLTVPSPIKPETDYTATLEFEPPKGSFAIASLASDKVEYPQKQAKEIFRVMPEDNILERIFTSNNENANEYVIASIGITKTSISDLNVRLSLTGFGYAIKRVNVKSEKKGNNL